MSISTSRQAYQDCYRVYDAAMEDERGVRIKLDSENAALHFRSRMHYARKIVRQDNARIYEDDHPMWNACVYDKLVVRIREDDNGWYIYVELGGIGEVEIESLSALALEDQSESTLSLPEPPKPLMIEHVKRRV